MRTFRGGGFDSDVTAPPQQKELVDRIASGHEQEHSAVKDGLDHAHRKAALVDAVRERQLKGGLGDESRDQGKAREDDASFLPAIARIGQGQRIDQDLSREHLRHDKTDGHPQRDVRAHGGEAAVSIHIAQAIRGAADMSVAVQYAVADVNQ